MKIGIVGYGFVGAAVARSFAGLVELVICDTSVDARNRVIKDLSGRGGKYGAPTIVSSIEQMPMGMDAVYVCVPTLPKAPMGECDDTILVGVINQLINRGINTIISKCTAPPSTYAQLPSQIVAYAPEFLRAATAKEDYMNQQIVTVGVNHLPLANRVVAVHKASSISHVPIQTIPREAAVMAKYAHNVSLAVKVAVMNEIEALATLLHIDWRDVVKGMAGTSVTSSHTMVPGPDGRHGFGGACFPKDVAAYLAEAKNVQADSETAVPFATIQAAFDDWCQTDTLAGRFTGLAGQALEV